MSQTAHFFDADALLDRLLTGLKRRKQEVVFVLGSALSQPVAAGQPGVPGVNAIIDLIRAEFQDNSGPTGRFHSAVLTATPNRYQEAFIYLQGRRGQQAVNEIVRTAVLAAWTSSPTAIAGFNQAAIDEALRVIELDLEGWTLNPGTEHVGKLVAHYPDWFGKSLLTTNFDPLFEIAIHKAGGSYFRTILHSDGNLLQTAGMGCHVIHLHGYWYGSDTLHTGRQINQERPRLRASLATLLRNKLVVVCGYGGWDDAFTGALTEVVRDDAAYPDILWTFHEHAAPSALLLERLAPGIDRGRITLYKGIDCNILFPQLYNAWSVLEIPTVAAHRAPSNPVRVPEETITEILGTPRSKTIVEGDDEDRPPVVEICVGRDQELHNLKHSLAKVIFLTGFGGQGKSTVAAEYYKESQSQLSQFSYFVWRDCKEEGERFEIQLGSVIERLSHGTIRGKDLARQTTESIVGILITLIRHATVLFVFDNVDHYVDLESRRMIGSVELFIEALRTSASGSQALFTCRPTVHYASDDILSIELTGITVAAAQSLFSQRHALSTSADIEEAHLVTEGHAFWLDLLAIQAAQGVPGRDLRALLAEVRAGGGPLPATLHSIWSTLKDREQAVLRVMAETVKPANQDEIADYLADKLNYNKVARALRTVRSLNLTVVKRLPDGHDLLELHPLVRHFIRQSFHRTEQSSLIGGIIRAYKRIMGQDRPRLVKRPPLSLLQYWTQVAELDLATGNIEDAFAALAEVSVAFSSSAYPREFTRVCRLLFSSIDWASLHYTIPGFERLVAEYTQMLAYLGRTEDVDHLLEKYEHTVPNKDARYLKYCGMRSFAYWVRNDFSKALEWGRLGADLVAASNVDTKFAETVKYTLALAERDAGQPDSALAFFLDGRQLTEVIDPEELDEARGEQYYGNIGRCLHLMGQIESALICYQKSGLTIERNPIREHVVNQGYIRTWIGELLIGRGDYVLARIFLSAAIRKWELVAPPKAGAVTSSLKQIQDRAGESLTVSHEDAEKICLEWILGRDVERAMRAVVGR